MELATPVAPQPKRGLGIDIPNPLGGVGSLVGGIVGGTAEVAADTTNKVPELLDTAMSATVVGLVLALGGVLIVVGAWRVVS